MSLATRSWSALPPRCGTRSSLIHKSCGSRIRFVVRRPKPPQPSQAAWLRTWELMRSPHLTMGGLREASSRDDHGRKADTRTMPAGAGTGVLRHVELAVEIDARDLPTMATDGTRIVYNPAFVDELKPAELEGTLAHEVLHCALGHHCRRGNRDPGLWNEAADLAINPILIKNGFTLPSGALIDPAFTNLSAEEIYARLLQKRGDGSAATKQGPQQTKAAGGMGNGPQGTCGAGMPDSKG